MDLSVELLKLSVADGGGEDRLSALPDDVLIHILVLVKDAAAAARTSILASRWRRLWPLLPELRFGSIEHHLIGAALAAHEAPDLSLILAHTKDASPESISAWLPIAARSLSGAIQLKVVRLESETEAEAGDRCDIDLPCFKKATTIMLELGFLGLALPSSGVFAKLGDLKLVDIQLHGQSSGLGDLLSSQRCPSLRFLLVSDVRGLDNFNIQSDSLLHMKLSYLHHLQQLTVVAPALKRLKVSRCFADPLNPDLSVANISAPQLTSLGWKNIFEPSSTQLDKMMHLEKLGIELIILEAEEVFEHNQYCMTLLRRFQRIHTLDLLIFYPPAICTGPYLMEHMPRLPDITSLELCVVANGHSFGANAFDVLRRCPGVKKLDLDFLSESQLEEQTMCPSGCICDQPPNWRTEELALNCLEEIEIHDMRGTEHEFAFVQRIFYWTPVLKRMQIIFHESGTESKAKELSQLLLSYGDMKISISVA
ncbi:putative F-box/FBD/LRR-repeat protein At4g03220 [Lolium rigidum]|uniref:putative F-box/FBD/LRR-repeat protein At4g03220 n=1 Tax=Lolium rigidum TaxID=89674 RepID=UPI001F5D438C|nr:putative F-box/FBD/LRR-repeat protein At4g03220 [Lolium rigidum]